MSEQWCTQSVGPSLIIKISHCYSETHHSDLIRTGWDIHGRVKRNVSCRPFTETQTKHQKPEPLPPILFQACIQKSAVWTADNTRAQRHGLTTSDFLVRSDSNGCRKLLQLSAEGFELSVARQLCSPGHSIRKCDLYRVQRLRRFSERLWWRLLIMEDVWYVQMEKWWEGENKNKKYI